MPRSGDVNVYKNDSTVGRMNEFNAQNEVLDIPNEIKVDYSLIQFVRCNCTARQISALKRKKGKETGSGESDADYPETNS